MKRPYLTLLFALGCSLVLAPQCVGGGKGANGGAGSGSTGSPDAGAGDRMTLGEGGGGGTEDVSLDALCGGVAEESVACIPDDADDCRDVMAPATEGSTTSSTGGTGGTGGTTSSTDGEGGLGGEAGQAGAPSDVPIDGGSDVEVPTDGGGFGNAGFACRVVADEDDEPVRTCLPAGPGGLDAPCTSAGDCKAGFGCVLARGAAYEDRVGAGVCREYCCRGSESCATGSYCATRVSLGVDGPGLSVPVCARGDNCSLAAPYPCAEGEECQCDEGQACLVVRSGGTTTCAEPGEGVAGDDCPCAWGHVCSQATQTCLKLCELPATGNDCEGGLCQMAADLPENWGVCIETAGD